MIYWSLDRVPAPLPLSVSIRSKSRLIATYVVLSVSFVLNLTQESLLMQVNSYFDDQVLSLSFDNSNGKSSIYLQSSGSYEFSTSDDDPMVVISGALVVQRQLIQSQCFILMERSFVPLIKAMPRLPNRPPISMVAFTTPFHRLRFPATDSSSCVQVFVRTLDQISCDGYMVSARMGLIFSRLPMHSLTIFWIRRIRQVVIVNGWLQISMNFLY